MNNSSDLIIELKSQRDQFVQQKEHIQSNYNQILGAIFALDAMIKKFEDKECSSGEESGETNNE